MFGVFKNSGPGCLIKRGGSDNRMTAWGCEEVSQLATDGKE